MEMTILLNTDQTLNGLLIGNHSTFLNASIKTNKQFIKKANLWKCNCVKTLMLSQKCFHFHCCVVEVKGSLRNPTAAANKEAGDLGVKQKCR